MTFELSPLSSPFSQSSQLGTFSGRPLESESHAPSSLLPTSGQTFPPYASSATAMSNMASFSPTTPSHRSNPSATSFLGSNPSLSTFPQTSASYMSESVPSFGYSNLQLCQYRIKQLEEQVQRATSELMALQGKYEATQEANEALQRAFQTVAGSANSVSALPAVVESYTIRFPPLSKQDHPATRFWDSRDHDIYKKEAKNMRGPTKEAGAKGAHRVKVDNENVTAHYMEYIDGERWDGDRLTAARKTLRNALETCGLKGFLAPTLSEIGADGLEIIYGQLLEQFPEFRYCSVNWKAHQLATDAYPGWYKGYKERLARQARGERMKSEEHDVFMKESSSLSPLLPLYRMASLTPSKRSLPLEDALDTTSQDYDSDSSPSPPEKRAKTFSASQDRLTTERRPQTFRNTLYDSRTRAPSPLCAVTTAPTSSSISPNTLLEVGGTGVQAVSKEIVIDVDVPAPADPSIAALSPTQYTISSPLTAPEGSDLLSHAALIDSLTADADLEQTAVAVSLKTAESHPGSDDPGASLVPSGEDGDAARPDSELEQSTKPPSEQVPPPVSITANPNVLPSQTQHLPSAASSAKLTPVPLTAAVPRTRRAAKSASTKPVSKSDNAQILANNTSSARNLCLKDWLSKNHAGLKKDFIAYWSSIEKTEIEQEWKVRSSEAKRIAKEAQV